MKKRILSLILMMIIVVSMAACAPKGPAEFTVDLAKDPIIEDKIFKTEGELTIHFEFPEAGYFKLMAYDATEYKEEPSKSPAASVSYYNDKGYAAYKDINIDNGYLQKCRFEKGTLTAKITFAGANGMEAAGLYWTFAPDTEGPTALIADQPAAKGTNGSGEAQFSLKVEKPSLYNIYCSEAAVWESDCSFEIYNADGESVTGELAIHSTEWISRKVFLQKGEYEIHTRDIQGVATITAELMTAYDQITLAGAAAPTLPATIGFGLGLAASQRATFTLDGSTPELWASAIGTGEYYDSMQTFTLVVRDSAGNEIVREDVEDGTMINLAGRTGTHTVEISNAGNSVVTLLLDK